LRLLREFFPGYLCCFSHRAGSALRAADCCSDSHGGRFKFSFIGHFHPLLEAALSYMPCATASNDVTVTTCKKLTREIGLSAATINPSSGWKRGVHVPLKAKWCG